MPRPFAPEYGDPSEQELLPCPFCGSANVEIREFDNATSCDYACVACRASSGRFSDMWSAAAAWNHRAPLLAAQPVAQELRNLAHQAERCWVDPETPNKIAAALREFADIKDTPKTDLPFATVEHVCNALTKLGISLPESTAECAARADELVNDLCDAVLRKPVAQEPMERWARAAISWVLYHHQGGNSAIGQPLRFALGLGAHEPLPDWCISEAKKWAIQAGAKTSEFHAAAQTGAPEGWKLVPIEPTTYMVVDGFESEPDEFFSSPAEWAAYDAMSGCAQGHHRAKLCWAAMLAAAPTPSKEA